MPTLNGIKTLQEVIDYTDVYDINNVTYFTKVDHLVVKSTTAFQRFYPYIKQYLQTYAVTKEQREHYRYRPDLLSSDIYGTPTLGWFIMWMNGQECPSKFRLKQSIVLVPPTDIQTLFITIKTKNQDKLENNWTDYLSNV